VTTGGEGRGKRAQRRKERRSIVEIVEDETEGQPASTAA
jgi:hypothetical protein